MGNFYFRPKLKTTISLPILNLFQLFLFYIRDFIWIIPLTEKSKFEENCQGHPTRNVDEISVQESLLVLRLLDNALAKSD